MKLKHFFSILIILMAAVPVKAQTVTDVNGNVYKTVTIGLQVWMAENYRAVSYRDNTPIPKVTVNTQWSSLTTEAYCWYTNDSVTYSKVYGALYNWKTVESGKLCPTGWHVPTKAEYDTLAAFLGGATIAGGKLKETGTTHWNNPNTGGTNSSGFTGVPGGYRNSAGVTDNLGSFGYYWTSTQSSANDAYHRLLANSAADLYEQPTSKKNGYSVRCLNDVLKTGIQMHNNPGFSIFPNPFHSSANVFLPVIENAELSIVNIYGQTVKTLNHFSASEIKIDRENLPNGIYFIFLIQNNKIIAKEKIVMVD
jgi:uncharacterized protein (TIGR02145 family)